MPARTPSEKLVRLRVIAGLCVVSGAVILGAAPRTARATLALTSSASAQDAGGTDSHGTPRGATSGTVSALSPLGGASATASGSASYGSVDGSATASGGPGAKGVASVHAFFVDDFS